MDRQDDRAGIVLMCLVMAIFAFQDTLSKHLAQTYNVFLVAMIRYWFMAALAVALASRVPGGVRAAARTTRLPAQLLRGLLLALQICLLVAAFVSFGLIETHAVFAATPLLIAALAAPTLGERVGWRRWVAIGIGFAGVLVILRPGVGVFSPYALIALVACVNFAIYSLLTRSVAADDEPATSFLWTGIVGLVVLTPIGLWRWQSMNGADWAVMALLCVVSGFGHLLLIRVYALAEASAVQPFSYLQLVFATVLAVAFLGETLSAPVALGAALVVGAGVFTILSREA